MSETQPKAHFSTLLPRLSPQEGVLVLSLILRTQIMRLREVLRLATDERRDRLIRMLGDKEELAWRCRRLLSSLDATGFREGAVARILGDHEDLRPHIRHVRRVPGKLFQNRQLKQRLLDLGKTETNLLELAAMCRDHFQESDYRDEFRICAQLAEDHVLRFQGEQAA